MSFVTIAGGSGGSQGSGSGGDSGARHYRHLHRHRATGGASYSLNRINETHETEATDNEEEEAGAGQSAASERLETGGDTEAGDKAEHGDSEEQAAGARGRRQFTPQLSSESEGEPPPGTDILTRYLLDTIGRSETRSRGSREATEDSLNSSDSEYNTEEDRRRNKVNLRQLEERLNMIQEECNWSDDAESDDERSATIDDRSERNEPMDILDDSEILDCRNNNGELPSDDDLEQIDNDATNLLEFESVFNKIDQFLDNSKLLRKRSSGRSRSEGKSR